MKKSLIQKLLTTKNKDASFLVVFFVDIRKVNNYFKYNKLRKEGTKRACRPQGEINIWKSLKEVVYTV